ncbi:MAG: DUF169 domain-containing protein [Alicyclobacillus sp.]|nr:DUF169 domain-containing protein [Alicyclobacillus sp.]
MDAKELASAIEQHVRPDTFPVGIRIVREEGELPARYKRPSRDFGERITICQAVGYARRYGWTIAMNGADLSCPIAQVAFGYQPALDYYTEGNLVCGMYTGDPESARRTEADVPRLTAAESGYYVAFPLERAPFNPDVVVVYANSAQVMRLVAGMLFRRGGSIPSTFSARADCADIAIRTLRTGQPQVILPCYGDRVFAQTQDHEMAFSFPFADAEELVEGLSGTHKGGVRYPVPQFLKYTAEFPATYQKLSALFEAAGAAGAGDEA